MADSLNNVRGGYDRWAAVYDHDANPLPPLEEPMVDAMIGEVAGLAVLDLGCGTGRHALRLAAAGAKVTGVDFSEGMLAQARGKAGDMGVRFVAQDLHCPLPFEAATFNAVVSGLVLEHLRDVDGFFGQIARMLKPRGRAVVTGMHPAMFLRGSQARFTDPNSGELIQPGSINHSMGSLVMAAIHSGLEMIDIQEAAPDAAFARRFPRAEKYVGWPMVVGLSLGAPIRGAGERAPASRSP